MASLTKNPQPPTKNYFSSADKKICWSVWVIEQLSSAIGGGAMVLVRQPKTAGFRLKSRYDIFLGRLSKCYKVLPNCFILIFCCDRKAWATSVQSFSLWQQATIEITCHDHSSIACSRHIYIVLFFARIPFLGNRTFLHNASRLVATLALLQKYRVSKYVTLP